MGLQFDITGRLFYMHGCEGCDRFPLDDPDEPCLLCGYTTNEINKIHHKTEAMNEAYEKYGQEFEENPKRQSRNAYLHVANISLGGGDYDYITLTDIDMGDDIRELADLTDEMVEVVFIPTGIVIKDAYDGDDYWEDDDE